ncbi:MAG: hypothetical protein N3A01_08760 [Bacteroidales bacterium]|nr:hypothetical protein [Bacteroidales bacterium]
MCDCCVAGLTNKFFKCDSIISYENKFKIYLTLIETSRFVIEHSGKKYYYASEKKFNSKINKLLKRYENSGYPFCQIFIDSLYIQNNVVFLLYKLRKNSFISYDSIDVIGNKYISKNFLMSYLNLRKGKPYNESHVAITDQLINDLAFIKTKEASKVFFYNDKVIVRCFIEKNSFQQFYGVAGFSNQENKLTFTGEINFSLLNTLKHADFIRFNWKSYSKESQKLQASFGYPYLLDLPFGIEYNLLLDKHDTSYVNSVSNPSVFYYLLGLNGIGFSYSQKNSVVSKYTNNEKFRSFKSYAYGINLRYSRLNRQYLPRKGIRINLSLNYLLTTFADLANKRHISFSLKSDFYFDIYKRFVVKLNNSTEYISNVVYKNELIKFGGSKNLRGFDEESIFANAYHLLSLELRYILGNETQVYPFYDFSVFNYENKNYFAHATGFGIDLFTKNGIFFVTYGIGKVNPMNFLWKNIKVHFGYKTLI